MVGTSRTGTELTDFWAGWDGKLNLVRFAEHLTRPFGLSADDTLFASSVGLPDWAAPHLNFDCDPSWSSLPEVPHIHGDLQLGATGVIGSAHEGELFLCAGRKGHVYVNTSAGPVILNASLVAMASCVRSYNACVARVLSGSVDDAWRLRKYDAELDRDLLREFVRLDPAVADTGSYWQMHLLDRAAR